MTEATNDQTQLAGSEEVKDLTPENGAEDAKAETGLEKNDQPEEVAAAPEVEQTESMDQSEADFDDDDDEEGSGEASFAELYEQSLERLQEGSVVSGTVVQVTDDFAVVDVGAKSEGQIPLHEFKDMEGDLEVGMEVEVLLESSEDEEGGIRLSRSKAARIKVWEQVAEAYRDEGTIEGRISGRVKGGLSVDVGVQAFLPGSQIDLRPVRDMEGLIGQTMEFKILKYSKKRSNVVLSRRVILETERESKKTKLMEVLDDEAVLDGVVKNITDYGAFIDLGGLDGLLHITDMSWGRISHPSERFNVGDDVKVKVLNFDRDKERVSLGVKQLTDDPWASVIENYPVGARVEGRVVSLTDYGAFVELEEGVEGLVHVSEMSWTQKVRHPSKVVEVGDMVETVVLSVDPERRRISLGMKQVMPDPWLEIEEQFPVGATIEGVIKNVTDFGVFIGIADGVDGLVHISDLSWSKRIKHPSEVCKKGDSVRAVVLNIDKENRRFSLGIKQAQIDPWESVGERYPVGSVIEGSITNVTDFGVFMELEEGIEGLVHVSELAKEKVDTPVGRYEVGDKLSAKVIHLSPIDRRIGLSVKRIDEEEGSFDDYVRPRQDATSNLGELLMEQLNAEKDN